MEKLHTKFKISLRIENIVATVQIAEDIDLDLLSSKYADIQSKRGFPGLLVRIKKPKATVLIFKSGKLVLTGLKLESELPIIIEKISNRLKYSGIQVYETPSFQVQNMVVKGDYGKKINLDFISLHLDRAIYEPEIFPGVIYRNLVPKMSFLFFSSGKFIVTGVKSEVDLVPAVKTISNHLRRIDAFSAVGESRVPKKVDFLELVSE